MGRTKLPPRSNRGFVVEHRQDGRVGRTYHHNEAINGKLQIHWEQTEGKKDFSNKSTLVLPQMLKIIGQID
jgi:hypothetical protein